MKQGIHTNILQPHVHRHATVTIVTDLIRITKTD